MKTIILTLIAAASMQAQITICQVETGAKCDATKSLTIPADVLLSLKAFRDSQATPPSKVGDPIVEKYATDWDLFMDRFSALIDEIVARHPTAKIQAKILGRRGNAARRHRPRLAVEFVVRGGRLPGVKL
jgi:hypothetical protein